MVGVILRAQKRSGVDCWHPRASCYRWRNPISQPVASLVPGLRARFEGSRLEVLIFSEALHPERLLPLVHIPLPPVGSLDPMLSVTLSPGAEDSVGSALMDWSGPVGIGNIGTFPICIRPTPGGAALPGEQHPLGCPLLTHGVSPAHCPP